MNMPYEHSSVLVRDKDARMALAEEKRQEPFPAVPPVRRVERRLALPPPRRLARQVRHGGRASRLLTTKGELHLRHVERAIGKRTKPTCGEAEQPGRTFDVPARNASLTTFRP